MGLCLYYVFSSGYSIHTAWLRQKGAEMTDKLLTIPKEKPLHRMKNGIKDIRPLNQEEIIQLLKMHQWNVDDQDAVKDLVELIRAVEKVHGVV